MNSLNSKQRAIVLISFVSFACFLLISVFIFNNSNSQTDNTISVSDASYTYSIVNSDFSLMNAGNFDVNNSLKAEDQSTVIQNIALPEMIGKNFEMTVDPLTSAISIESGMIYAETKDLDYTFIWGPEKIQVLPQSKVFIDADNGDIYVISGAAWGSNKAVAVNSQALAYVNMNYVLRNMNLDKFVENKGVNEIVYLLYDLDKLPSQLEAYSPESLLY